MAIDTPATIAVLGAGPLGLEAALYARFLGYSVVIYEQGEIAEHVRRLGHLQMFETFGDCSSNLGRAAVVAQQENLQLPLEVARLSAGQWRDQYLLPLSQTDLLSDSFKLHTRVLGVTKGELLKSDLAGNPDRGDWPFRIVSVNVAGEEAVDEVDAVFDCTGVLGQPNGLGEGGLPALGERTSDNRILRSPPDALEADRGRFAGKHTVVVGSGCSAAASIVALAELAQTERDTRITWITRREQDVTPLGPVATIQNDPLPARTDLINQANQLAHQSSVTWWPGTWVERITSGSDGFQVKTTGQTAETLTCDELISAVGNKPDTSLHRELQVGLDPASEAVAENLLTGEPNYYVLGAKSFGRRSGFRFRDGLQQIREIFKVIGDRPALDLYASTVKL